MNRQSRRFLDRYRVTDGRRFRLADHDPDDTFGLASEFKDDAQVLLKTGVARAAELQEMLYAQDQWAVLLIFQAMDAAGKDSTIKHVMSGINPQGCHVSSFKAPSTGELDHDFLRRHQIRLPERGHIGIFNRSHYEEVVVVRVHPEFLERQKIPPQFLAGNVWMERYEDIVNWESYLHRNGMVIRKFFLHVSKKEQKKRFMERLERPEKNWKFSLADVHERRHWNEYMKAYQDAIRRTATRDAPWFVVPADNKWFTRLVVMSVIVEALESLDLAYPEVDKTRRGEIEQARKMLARKDA